MESPSRISLSACAVYSVWPCKRRDCKFSAKTAVKMAWVLASSLSVLPIHTTWPLHEVLIQTDCNKNSRISSPLVCVGACFSLVSYLGPGAEEIAFPCLFRRKKNRKISEDGISASVVEKKTDKSTEEDRGSKQKNPCKRRIRQIIRLWRITDLLDKHGSKSFHGSN